MGHDQVTNDHLKRTFIDMKDRLVRGMDQRWAYVSVSMWYGKVPSIRTEVTEEEADRKLRDFVAASRKSRSTGIRFHGDLGLCGWRAARADLRIKPEAPAWMAGTPERPFER